MPLPKQLVVTALLLFFTTLSSAACVHVAPYERGKLARPDMSTADMLGAGEQHVRAVHEGANGGTTIAESGCGCN